MYNLNLFYNGWFGYFGLQQTEVIQCYTAFTAANYFQELAAEWRLANATAQANKANMETYAALVITLNSTLASTSNCVVNTQQYQELLIAAHINTFNKKLSLMLHNLYYQAYYGEWFRVMDPVMTLLENQQFHQAGRIYGALFELFAKNASSSHEYYMAYKGFVNGLFLYFNISEPEQMPSCYNDTTAQNAFNFYYYWARTVNTSTLNNVINNTILYFETIGKQIEELTKTQRLCENTTANYVALSNALGAQIYSPTFRQAVLTYMENDVVNYVTTFLEISTFFGANSAQAAGGTYGNFFDQVVTLTNSLSSQEL